MFTCVYTEEHRRPENSSTMKVEKGGAGDTEASAPHLSFDYPVHDGLHGFHLVTLHDSFEVLRAMFEGLRDRDVQVVVGLLSSQVLQMIKHPVN